MADGALIFVLKEIAKELHEINKRLDRMCRASIFSVQEPIVNVGQSTAMNSQQKHIV